VREPPGRSGSSRSGPTPWPKASSG
jgi:hypothetical protein